MQYTRVRRAEARREPQVGGTRRYDVAAIGRGAEACVLADARGAEVGGWWWGYPVGSEDSSEAVERRWWCVCDGVPVPDELQWTV